MKISKTITQPGTALPFARPAMARANGWSVGMAGVELPILARLRDRFDGIVVSAAATPAYVPTDKQTRLHVPLAPQERRL